MGPVALLRGGPYVLGLYEVVTALFEVTVRRPLRTGRSRLTLITAR